MNQKGFTLIEIIVVISLIIIIAGITMSTNIDSFRGYNFRNDREILINTLQRARSQAINNMCLGTCPGQKGLPHGIHFESGTYTLFQGSSWNSTDHDLSIDEVTAINPAMTISGPTDIIFAELSGNASVNPAGGVWPNGWKISITDNINHASVITVNPEGQIKWTN